MNGKPTRLLITNYPNNVTHFINNIWLINKKKKKNQYLREEDLEVGVAGGQLGDIVGADGVAQLVVEHHPLLAHLLDLIQEPLELFDAGLVFARLQHLTVNEGMTITTDDHHHGTTSRTRMSR